MEDVFADVFLEFASFTTIFFVTIVGTLATHRRLFIQVLFLISIDLIINVVLKGTFRFPLPDRLHTTAFAFPSGHMQLTTVFYLWWACFLPSRFIRCIIAMIIIGQGLSLIHYGYHTVEDVTAAFVVGCALVAGYIYILSLHIRFLGWALIGFSSLLMAYNYLMYSTIPSHAVYAYLALLGFAAYTIIVPSARDIYKLYKPN